MENKSLILDSINKVLKYTQDKSVNLYEESFFLKNIDNLIFATIMLVFVLSTFASSDSIGYVALITLFLTIIKLITKKDGTLNMNLFEVFLFVYFLIVIISLFGSSLFHLSLKGFLKTFTYLGFYFSAVQYYKNNLSKIFPSIILIALCAASQGIWGIIQNFAQVGEISTWQDVTNINPEDVMTRVYGTLQPFNPNLFGGYLVASLPCLLGSVAILITKKNFRLALIASIISILTISALVLSGCRGAYIGLLTIILCIIGFSAKYIWQYKNETLKKLFWSIIGGVVVAATSVALLVSSIRTRIFSIFAMRGDSSTSFRLNVYQSALHMFKDNWLLGIGIGNQNFREIYGLYMRTGFDALSSYNVFLEIAVESGIFALTAFLGFIATVIFKSIKFLSTCVDVEMILIIIISLTTIIAVMVHGFVDTIFFRPQVQFIFWMMVAFISVTIKENNA